MRIDTDCALPGADHGFHVRHAIPGTIIRRKCRIFPAFMHFPCCPLRRHAGFHLLGRCLDPDLEMGEHAANGLAQAGQHAVEQVEGFALVFVQRVLLGIGTQIDALTQVIQ